MDIALAVVTIATAVAVGVVSVFLLTRLVRTIVELRRITVGLNDVLGWAVGRVLHVPYDGPGDDGTATAAHKLGSG
jgi:hypothetical protein